MQSRSVRLFSATAVLALTSFLAACSSNDGPRTASGGESRAYYNTPGYQAQQPFAANPPFISTFYDSGYEESLYSPFSFN